LIKQDETRVHAQGKLFSTQCSNNMYLVIVCEWQIAMLHLLRVQFIIVPCVPYSLDQTPLSIRRRPQSDAALD